MLFIGCVGLNGRLLEHRLLSRVFRQHIYLRAATATIPDQHALGSAFRDSCNTKCCASVAPHSITSHVDGHARVSLIQSSLASQRQRAVRNRGPDVEPTFRDSTPRHRAMSVPPECSLYGWKRGAWTEAATRLQQGCTRRHRCGKRAVGFKLRDVWKEMGRSKLDALREAYEK